MGYFSRVLKHQPHRLLRLLLHHHHHRRRRQPQLLHLLLSVNPTLQVSKHPHLPEEITCVRWELFPDFRQRQVEVDELTIAGIVTREHSVSRVRHTISYHLLHRPLLANRPL